MKRKHKVIGKNQKGFSLVEILLAIVILSLIVTPILQIFVSSMNISNRSRKLLGATEVAQMTLEVLNSKAMEGAGGIQEMITQSGAHVLLPALDTYVPANTSFGSTGFTEHSAFVGALKSAYGNNTSMLCLVSDTESVKRFSLHNVRHNGYQYDVVVSMEADKEPSDEYFTYDVYLEVFDVKDGNHYNKRLLIMESAVINKY